MFIYEIDMIYPCLKLQSSYILYRGKQFLREFENLLFYDTVDNFLKFLTYLTKKPGKEKQTKTVVIVTPVIVY